MADEQRYAHVIGEQVRVQRVRLGMTQAELAQRAHVSRHLVLNVESGEAPGISLSKLAAILEVLGLRLAVVTGIALPHPAPYSPTELDAHFSNAYPLDTSLFGGSYAVSR